MKKEGEENTMSIIHVQKERRERKRERDVDVAYMVLCLWNRTLNGIVSSIKAFIFDVRKVRTEFVAGNGS